MTLTLTTWYVFFSFLRRVSPPGIIYFEPFETSGIERADNEFSLPIHTEADFLPHRSPAQNAPSTKPTSRSSKPGAKNSPTAPRAPPASKAPSPSPGTVGPNHPRACLEALPEAGHCQLPLLRLGGLWVWARRRRVRVRARRASWRSRLVCWRLCRGDRVDLGADL